jgi:hypothetical protein
MADSDYATLQAMFGGLNQGASVEDITGFQNTIAANNIYRQIAKPVLGAQFNTSTWTPNQTIAATAAQAFLGSALNALGQRSESNQLESLAAALPSLYANPLGTPVPEGVDPMAFNTVRAQTLARGTAQNQVANQSAILDMFKANVDAKAAAESAKNAAKGKIEGENEAWGTTAGGAENPESPKAKKLTDLQSKFNALEEVQNFKYVQRLSKQLSDTIKNPLAVADPLIAKMAVQLVEPKLAVNAGEAAGLAASTSIPGEWKAAISQSLTGGTKLPPEVKAGLIEIMKDAYKAHAGSYSSTFNQFKNEAKYYGIDSGRISPIGDPLEFDQFIGDSKTETPKPKYKESELIAKGYTKGPNGWIPPTKKMGATVG